jgi:hypothetical protein
MKTVKNIKSEIADLTSKKVDRYTTEYNRTVAQLAFLNACLYYLQTNPSEEFVKREAERLENYISSKMELFKAPDAETTPKPVITKLKKAHEDFYELSKYRLQLKTLRFLLAA